MSWDYTGEKRWFQRQIRKAHEMDLYVKYPDIRSAVDKLLEMKVTLGDFCDDVFLPVCKECAEKRGWSGRKNMTCCGNYFGYYHPWEFFTLPREALTILLELSSRRKAIPRKCHFLGKRGCLTPRQYRSTTCTKYICYTVHKGLKPFQEEWWGRNRTNLEEFLHRQLLASVHTIQKTDYPKMEWIVWDYGLDQLRRELAWRRELSRRERRKLCQGDGTT